MVCINFGTSQPNGQAGYTVADAGARVVIGAPDRGFAQVIMRRMLKTIDDGSGGDQT